MGHTIRPILQEMERAGAQPAFPARHALAPEMKFQPDLAKPCGREPIAL